MIRSWLCTLSGAVVASKWYGTLILNGWTGAQRPLNLSQMFFKKSAANQLWYLYLLLQLGQSSIKEINFFSKITHCPFKTSPALQKITSANLGAWIDPVPIVAALSFADGYLLQQVLSRQTTTVQCSESQIMQVLEW